MATRCNIIINGKGGRTIVYRHFDGYPEVTFEHLKRFMKAIHLSGEELTTEQLSQKLTEEFYYEKDYITKEETRKTFPYKLTNQVHGDIDYLYQIRLDNKLVSYESMGVALECRGYHVGYFDYAKDQI